MTGNNELVLQIVLRLKLIVILVLMVGMGQVFSDVVPHEVQVTINVFSGFCLFLAILSLVGHFTRKKDER